MVQMHMLQKMTMFLVLVYRMLAMATRSTAGTEVLVGLLLTSLSLRILPLSILIRRNLSVCSAASLLAT